MDTATATVAPTIGLLPIHNPCNLESLTFLYSFLNPLILLYFLHCVLFLASYFYLELFCFILPTRSERGQIYIFFSIFAYNAFTLPSSFIFLSPFFSMVSPLQPPPAILPSVPHTLSADVRCSLLPSTIPTHEIHQKLYQNID